MWKGAGRKVSPNSEGSNEKAVSKMKKINKPAILAITILLLLITVTSFFAAWAEEESTIGNIPGWLLFARMFSILRFPTHTLMWNIFSERGVLIYLLGLVINCLIYALAIERVITLIQKKKAS